MSKFAYRAYSSHMLPVFQTGWYNQKHFCKGNIQILGCKVSMTDAERALKTNRFYHDLKTAEKANTTTLF